jgi:hypothetical protein
MSFAAAHEHGAHLALRLGRTCRMVATEAMIGMDFPATLNELNPAVAVSRCTPRTGPTTVPATDPPRTPYSGGVLCAACR